MDEPDFGATRYDDIPPTCCTRLMADAEAVRPAARSPTARATRAAATTNQLAQPSQERTDGLMTR